jgi:hypothetical protein
MSKSTSRTVSGVAVSPWPFEPKKSADTWIGSENKKPRKFESAVG